MGWIILVPILIICAIAAWIISGRTRTAAEGAPSSDGEDFYNVTTWVLRVTSVFFFALVVIWTFLASVHQVPNGHVGAIYTFKAVTGTTGSGLVVTAPWQNVESLDVREQSFGWVAPEHREGTDFQGVHFVGGRMETFSEDNQDVYMDVSLNIKVDRGAVETILDNVGPDYFGKLFVTELPNILKEETVRYDSTVIAQHRDDIRVVVSERMQSILDDDGYQIKITKVGVFNMSFDPQYAQSIQDKEIAKQEAEQQQNLVAAERAKADQAIEQARGRGASIRIEAEGQADANQIINESLTPLLIQFQALQKLADNVQIALIPSGQGIIIDPATLLGLQPTPAPSQ